MFAIDSKVYETPVPTWGIVHKSLGLLQPSDIAKHRVDINETGKVKHFLYNRENRKAENSFYYNADKYWTRDFLNFIEAITTDWKKIILLTYVMVMSGDVL